MSYILRRASSQDFPQIFELIKSLAEFEKAPEQVHNSISQMNNEQHLFHSFVVEHKPSKKIIGCVLYFFAYYSWVGKSLYLDDLYVDEAHRRNGVGTMLLRKVFEIAKVENCKRIRWQVLNWNQGAIELYRKAGATIDNEWSNCDFDQNAIALFNL